MKTPGLIAAGDPQTAEAGAAVLRAGGNAVDAICASAFASFVVEPPLTSPAGAGVLLFGDVDAGFSVLDFFAAVPGLGLDPAAVERLDFHDIVVDFGSATQAFHVGRGAAAVPTGAFGLLDAHRRGGSMPLADLVAPAIRLAREGYVLGDGVRFVVELLEPIARLSPSVSDIFYNGDEVPPPRATLVNPRLADFLEALAAEGEALLRGPWTDALVDEFGPARGGLLTRADLDQYRPVVRAPLQVPFGPCKVLTNPPPSSGGALIALGLRLAERLDLGSFAYQGPDHIVGLASIFEVLSEVRSAGFDDRIARHGAVEALLADASIDRWAPRLASLFDERTDEVILQRERPLGSTTHISVLDGRGGAASMTMSNGEGCGYTLDKWGVHVNNFLGEEDINPHGFHKSAPGTWMTTMMSPTIAVKGGRPRLVLGSGGSNRIRTAVLQALVNALIFKRPIDECVSAPRIHVENKELFWEDVGLPDRTRAALAAVWPEASRFPEANLFFGGVHAVAEIDGRLVGGGDQRRGGAVASE